jgi:hypothetical protein
VIYCAVTKNGLYLKWLKGQEISYGSYQAILTEDFGPRQALAKFDSGCRSKKVTNLLQLLTYLNVQKLKIFLKVS